MTVGGRRVAAPLLRPLRSRVSRLRRAVGPPVRNGSVALLYHRVARADVDPWRLAVTPEHLSEHLEILARHTHPVTASALRSARERGDVPPGTAVVTFDDGYADLATEIAPRLERAGVPATMFVVSRAIDRDREFWWDALERALLGDRAGAGVLTLTVGGRVRRWEVGGATPRPDAHRAVWAELRGRPVQERDELTEQVLSWAGLPLRARPTHRTLRSPELHALASHGLVEIGAHTANHAWLAGLGPAGQRREVHDGRAELEALVGRPVTSFAYPHGGPSDVGQTAFDVVRAAEFDTAFLATPGRLRQTGDIHRLPRLFVEDMDGEGFARMLWRYAGIKVS